MALTKYYEDIVERLIEENSNLFNKYSQEKSSPNYINHVETHLKTANKLLTEVLDILTTPDSGATNVFISLDKKKLKTANDKLTNELDETKNNLNEKIQLNNDLNKENHKLDRKVNKLEQEIKQQKRNAKKK